MPQRQSSRVGDIVWVSCDSPHAVCGLSRGGLVRTGVTLDEATTDCRARLLTLLRVALLIAISSRSGCRRRADRTAPGARREDPAARAVPRRVPGEPAVPGVRDRHRALSLNPDIWLSPLIVLGTQWYILFNVIAGASAYPERLREAATNFRIRGWQWWRKAMLPGIFPYYVTGAITASGGAWNASIVAEFVQWG